MSDIPPTRPAMGFPDRIKGELPPDRFTQRAGDFAHFLGEPPARSENREASDAQDGHPDIFSLIGNGHLEFRSGERSYALRFDPVAAAVRFDARPLVAPAQLTHDAVIPVQPDTIRGIAPETLALPRSEPGAERIDIEGMAWSGPRYGGKSPVALMRPAGRPTVQFVPHRAAAPALPVPQPGRSSDISQPARSGRSAKPTPLPADSAGARAEIARIALLPGEYRIQLRGVSLSAQERERLVEELLTLLKTSGLPERSIHIVDQRRGSQP